jgi:hypothetical protein
MPMLPGHPGLLFSCQLDPLNYTGTMFSRNKNSAAEWLYVGEYKAELLGKLSAAQFAQVANTVRRFNFEYIDAACADCIHR